MTFVIQLKNDSLICLDCGELVSNTANSEMKHGGYYSHSHSCEKNINVRNRLNSELKG